MIHIQKTAASMRVFSRRFIDVVIARHYWSVSISSSWKSSLAYKVKGADSFTRQSAEASREQRTPARV
jgi:hypothetical protein